MIAPPDTHFLDLEEVWQTIAINLHPKDLLAFISSHRNINSCLSTSASLWKQLILRDRDDLNGDDDSDEIEKRATATGTTTSTASSAQHMRRAYLMQSFMSTLSSVKWLPISREMQHTQFPVKAREGHISCVLDGPADGYKSIVITGGFSDDQSVTVIELKEGNNNWGWTRLNPRCLTPPFSFVYGASLTALPSALAKEMEKDRFMKSNYYHRSGKIINRNVSKAIRFGGFEGGGYSGESNQVWILTIVDYEFEDETLDQFAVWEKIETQQQEQEHGTNFHPSARAYHSATLLYDRYLLIIGGMTSSGSCIDESILDIKEMKWIDASKVCEGEEKPKGRHGHSVVWDKRRDRLLLFGGGSGYDLLRSGTDNNEVWELKMEGIALLFQLETTSSSSSNSRWEWSMIRKNTLHQQERRNDDDLTMTLSPSESLCLGRCHNAMKVGPDTVLFMFGGGRPSTNGVIGYNLATDNFIRPKIHGPLPVPRFTGIATFLETEGYVLVHGGFNDNIRRAVLDMFVLDLAPTLGRNFAGFPLDEDRQSHEAVTDQAATNGQYGADFVSQYIMY